MKMRFAGIFVVLLTVAAFSCFDTYLFLNKLSLAYPKNMLAVEGFGEYSANSFGNPSNDAMFVAGNIYYGVTDRFSIQVGTETNEDSRGSFSFGSVGVRGVYNLIRKESNSYTLDATLQHISDMGGVYSFEASFPSVFNRGEHTFVVHPVMSLAKDGSYSFTAGGHVGAFRSFGQSAIVGLGAEYQSAQSASRFSKRLVEGEMATSLFLGAQVGPYLFWQNEFAKGLANSRDFGFATTFKILIR